MRPFERRAANAYPYYKLATWDGRNMVFRDGKESFVTEQEAKSAATKRGRYRISEVTDKGRMDRTPFDVD